jgi:hypothetical protein
MSIARLAVSIAVLNLVCISNSLAQDGRHVLEPSEQGCTCRVDLPSSDFGLKIERDRGGEDLLAEGETVTAYYTSEAGKTYIRRDRNQDTGWVSFRFLTHVDGPNRNHGPCIRFDSCPLRTNTSRYPYPRER